MAPTVIAIDGPAASGKGTLSERLAAHFGYAHLETGRLYRAVAAKLLAAGLTAPTEAEAAEAAQHLGDADLNSPHLYAEATGLMASKVSALGPVRAALLQFQRDFAARPPGNKSGAVIDGRDIGTVICPDAPHKLFVTASPEIRAQRRFAQLQKRGSAAIYAAVLRDIQDRDAMDTQRTNAPLRQAPDAHLLDTSDMTADQVFAAALSIISSSR
ncbi:MAG TPA: (d)CMP kinase [Alphaproteobacteria bacterium]|nr:(d)CMP kinase [Alphaproteobacteria bacterium]